MDDDPGSPEAYLNWWVANGGESAGYSLARHADRGLRPDRVFLLRFRTLCDVYDFFDWRFGPVLAAEGFRRALWVLAQLPRPDACTKYPPSPETGDAPERC